MIHVLKSQPVFFQPIYARRIHLDVRKNDRMFKVGDTVRFREFKPAGAEGWYSGREAIRTIIRIEPSTMQPDHVALFLVEP